MPVTISSSAPNNLVFSGNAVSTALQSPQRTFITNEPTHQANPDTFERTLSRREAGRSPQTLEIEPDDQNANLNDPENPNQLPTAPEPTETMITAKSLITAALCTAAFSVAGGYSFYKAVQGYQYLFSEESQYDRTDDRTKLGLTAFESPFALLAGCTSLLVGYHQVRETRRLISIRNRQQEIQLQQSQSNA